MITIPETNYFFKYSGIQVFLYHDSRPEESVYSMVYKDNGCRCELKESEIIEQFKELIELYLDSK